MTKIVALTAESRVEVCVSGLLKVSVINEAPEVYFKKIKLPYSM